MRVLIFHGYLLRGTGSNVYNASLAQALARLGHEVHLLCQDRRAEGLPWVGGSGPGTVTVHVPDIGGLLPVYVEALWLTAIGWLYSPLHNSTRRRVAFMRTTYEGTFATKSIPSKNSVAWQLSVLHSMP